jgi:hypothetical protein
MVMVMIESATGGNFGVFRAASWALLRALTVVAVLKHFPRDWQNEDRLGSTVPYCSDMV